MSSEIVHFRVQQAQQETSARLGLAGLAIVSRLDVIEALIQQGVQCILQLIARASMQKQKR